MGTKYDQVKAMIRGRGKMSQGYRTTDRRGGRVTKNSLRKQLRFGGRPFRLAAALLLASLSLAYPQAPALAAGTWSETGPLATARYLHTTTRLTDGRVLVAGGQADGGGYLASAEIFNPATGTWSGTGNLATARGGHTATLLADGRVLVAGGGAPGAINSVEIFNPATGTWSGVGPLPVPRSWHTATLLADGRVLVAGGINPMGDNLASAELFNPATLTWSSTNSMVTAHMDHTATLLANGRVLVVGPSVIPGNLVNAEMYTPATGTWAATGNPNTNRYGHTATLLANGLVLVAGGWRGGENIYSSAEIFSPGRGTWRLTGNMTSARISHTATLLPDGRVLVAGGNNFSTLSSAELYDPALETWSAADALTYGHQNHTATLLLDDRVLVTGGTNNFSSELFDPQSYVKNGSFETEAFFPDPYGLDLIAYWTEWGYIKYRGDWQPAEGTFSLDLNKASPGSIGQSIDTVPGKKYLVTFALAGNPESGPAVKTLRVSAGTQFHDFSFDITGKSIYNMGWTKKSWTFSAEGVLTNLVFQSLTSGSFGPALDNVRVIQDTQLSHLPPLLLLLN